MDSAFIHQVANELVQNVGTRNIKQLARSCSLDISETSRIKDMLGLLSLYFDKPLINSNSIDSINVIFSTTDSRGITKEDLMFLTVFPCLNFVVLRKFIP